MHTTLELIELAKQRLALRHALSLPMTDYRFGKLLKLRQGTVSNWRTGKTTIDKGYADMFADACELPAEYVMACIEHERTDDPKIRRIYENIADRFKAGCVVAAILAAGMAFAPSPAQALASVSKDSAADPLCIMRRSRRTKKTKAPTQKKRQFSTRNRDSETSLTA